MRIEARGLVFEQVLDFLPSGACFGAKTKVFGAEFLQNVVLKSSTLVIAFAKSFPTHPGSCQSELI